MGVSLKRYNSLYSLAIFVNPVVFPRNENLYLIWNFKLPKDNVIFCAKGRSRVIPIILPCLTYRHFKSWNQVADLFLSTNNKGKGKRKHNTDWTGCATSLFAIAFGESIKTAIDHDSVTGVLTIHIVGVHACFYLLQLKADGLYIMTEIGTVTMPLSIGDLRGYLSYMSDLKTILKLFEEQCLPIYETSRKRPGDKIKVTLKDSIQCHIQNVQTQKYLQSAAAGQPLMLGNTATTWTINPAPGSSPINSTIADSASGVYATVYEAAPGAMIIAGTQEYLFLFDDNGIHPPNDPDLCWSSGQSDDIVLEPCDNSDAERFTYIPVVTRQ
ncbi:uncharacterized protein BX664DRAFT_382673 [Halteromyces radiatus]|uniref:uncharacterized protein n=1 Tax=Halteromyces radiatus TaxID=101107 RepID=UPI00222121FC|nr:uncharacterized protein BX664DRAFT_382673 [Halteromyces radiatus]KAI8096187.1 hypothetical protein BX664DRAFT_382673 [Halteromyces radiatus]